MKKCIAIIIVSLICSTYSFASEFDIMGKTLSSKAVFGGTSLPQGNLDDADGSIGIKGAVNGFFDTAVPNLKAGASIALNIWTIYDGNETVWTVDAIPTARYTITRILNNIDIISDAGIGLSLQDDGFDVGIEPVFIFGGGATWENYELMSHYVSGDQFESISFTAALMF